MDDFDKELKVCFLDEAQQSALEVESCFLELESNPDNDGNINRIFRHVHNLKGSSRAVGFDNFADFTHQFESFILKVKNKEFKATSAVVDLLLKGNDQIAVMINELKSNLEAKFEFSDLLEKMKNFDPNAAGAASQHTDVAAPAAVHPAEETSHARIELQTHPPEESKTAQPEPNDQVGESVEVAPQALATQNAKTPSPAPSTAQKSANSDESIRVSIGKIDTLLNTIGELVILQGVLRETVQDSASPLLRKTVHQIRKVGKEIQDIAMSLRMVSVKPTFQKMQRIVRDTSQALGKDIFFEMRGEDSEVDKTVLEKINDPLVHLIRNAVDHGIESSETRVANGKPARGHVVLSAYNQSGKFVVEIKDDGGGINPEKLVKKAIEKKIIRADQKLSEKEALQLIFAPGFSTKEKVTDVSGRGVGMDVVRTNINELSGEIQIESVVGRGTTFKVVLPLTLSIIDAMILTYSGQKFVIPLNQVLETVSPSQDMIQRNTDLGETLMLRGENLPLIRMGDFFGIKSHRPADTMIAMILSLGRSQMAVLVDDILGQFEVVVKQLTPELMQLKGVTGTTILGDGKPALILDAQELVKRKLTPSYLPAQTGPTGKLNDSKKSEVHESQIKERQKMGNAA